MDNARKVAQNSTYPRQSLGAVLVYGGKVIATGFNTNKTNPMQKQYNVERGYNQDIKNNGICHAEMLVLQKTKYLDIDWSKATIYVYRELKNGSLACSKPCKACEKAMKERGVGKVYYTKSVGGYSLLMLN